MIPTYDDYPFGDWTYCGGALTTLNCWRFILKVFGLSSLNMADNFSHILISNLIWTHIRDLHKKLYRTIYITLPQLNLWAYSMQTVKMWSFITVQILSVEVITNLMWIRERRNQHHQPLATESHDQRPRKWEYKQCRHQSQRQKTRKFRGKASSQVSRRWASSVHDTASRAPN